jgi:hypothetical protein
MRSFVFTAIVCILLCFSDISLSAQSRTHVLAGTILDSAERTPLSGARVQILSSDNKPVGGSISDKNGRFWVKNIPTGNYTLVAEYVAFLPLRRSISVANTDTVRIGALRLRQDAVKLQEVNVTAKATRMEVKGDTLEFNASAFKTDKNAAAEDLIRKLPGLEVENNGTVKAQGQNVQRVLVDGKPFFGDDPTAALRNLPSEVIDRVQVLDQMSDQSQFTRFDDGDRVKTLNIVTKADRRSGQFGKVYAGYGTDDRYSAGGNVNFFNGDRRISIIGMSNNINQQNFSIQDILGLMGGGNNRMAQMMGGMARMFGGGGGGRMSFGGGAGGVGQFLASQSDGITQSHALGMNYSDTWAKNLTVTGSYFANLSNNTAEQDSKRQNFISDAITQNQFSNTGSSTKNMNHRLNFRMEYTIDSSNSIIFTPRITFQTNDRNSISASNTILEQTAQQLNVNNNRSVSDNTGYSFAQELLWRHRFSTQGRTLTVGVNSSYNNNVGDGTLFNEITNTINGTNLRNVLDQTTPSSGNSSNVSANVNYTESVSKNDQLQLSYNISRTVSESDRRAFDYNATTASYSEIPNQLNSNVASSVYTTHRPGVSYRLSWGSAPSMGGMMMMMAPGGGGANRGGGSPFGGGGGPFGGGDMGNGASSLNFGVEYQAATLAVGQQFPLAFDLSRTFTNILPNLSYSTRFGMTGNLRLNYRTSTNQPSIRQLQSVIDNSNPLALSTGNPDLDQEYTHNITANYANFNLQSASSFVIFARASLTQNRIANATRIATTPELLAQPNGLPSVLLRPGSSYSSPININGFWTSQLFFLYSFPFELVDGLKMTANINLGGNYTRDPQIINSVTNIANNTSVTPAVGLTSNISENLDFTLSWRTSYTTVKNSVQSASDNQFYTHTGSFRMNWILFDGWLWNTDFSYVQTAGLASGFNQIVPLWNMGVGKRFMDNDLEVRLSVFDLLKENNSIQQNVQSGFIEFTQTNVLRQYFLLTFTYNLRMFGGAGRS